MIDRRDANQTDEPTYEHSDLPVRRLLGIVLASVVAIAAVALLIDRMLVLFDMMSAPPAATPMEQVELRPPQPRLEARPVETLNAVEEREARLLEHYGWVDRDAGIARIPVERAMEILAERGWPAPVEGPPAVAAPPDRSASAAPEMEP
jgi:hypothetical protein